MSQHRPGIVTAIAEYGKQLFAFIRGRVGNDEDSEDIFQEVWFQLSAREEVETIEQVGSWLYRVARNKIVDRYRKKTTLSIEDLTVYDEDGFAELNTILLSDHSDPGTLELREIFWGILTQALNELPESQRSVFVRNELEGETLQHIADTTGEKLKTIISRKRYAVTYLREQLRGVYNELTQTNN